MLWYLSNKPKIAIIVPYDKRMIYMKWATSMNELIIPENYTRLIGSGLPRVDFEREDLVQNALGMSSNKLPNIIEYDSLFYSMDKAIETGMDNGADEIVFIDSDIIPPRDGILKFRYWNYPFVTGIYYERNERHYASIRMYVDGQYVAFDTNNIKQPYMFVDACGLGYAYIDAEIFKRLSRPWFKWTRETERSPSEDIYFAQKVWNELGIKPLADFNNVASHYGVADYGETIKYTEG